MCALQGSNDNFSVNGEVNCPLAIGDEDFYVLKFPHKLWRIVNECDTGAIQWGIYGKTILIDYNLFQAQYLECEVPKFKTRNMTSFVRQLNMYGFKKMQTQVKSESSRCCNIHEFFHDYFRYGRNDLLDSVKRRPSPLKGTRTVQNIVYHNHSRLQMCRDALAKALQRSRDRIHLGSRRSILTSAKCESYSKKDVSNKFNVQVIPVENSLKHVPKDRPCKDIVIEVSSKFQELADLNGELDDLKDESDTNSMEENSEEQLMDSIHSDDQKSCVDFSELPMLEEKRNFTNQPVYPTCVTGHPVQVKKAFDGSNYVIDMMVGCPDGTANMEKVVATILEAELYNETAMNGMQYPVNDCSNYFNEFRCEYAESAELSKRDRLDTDDEFYEAIANSYLGI